MTLNWFTVFAQILNFLILVWLLKRYLYKPVLSAVEERENKITSQLKDAEKMKVDATAERNTYERKNQEFNKTKEDMLQKATGEVEGKRLELLENARKEVQDMRDKFKKSLEDDYKELQEEIADKISEEVLTIIKTTLSTLANEDLEKQIISVFITNLKNLDEAGWDKIRHSVKTDQVLNVHSAFEVSEEQKENIRKEIEGHFEKQVELKFLTSDKMISGIEIAADEFKIAWSVVSYISSVEKSIDEIVSKAKMS